MSPIDWFGVAILGGAGALGRFLIDARISARRGRDFPHGTLTINLSGAFILGLLGGLALSTTTATLLGTAAIGSYTTFSTWMLETHRLREDSEFRTAALNIVVSLVLGVAAAEVGRVVGVAL